MNDNLILDIREVTNVAIATFSAGMMIIFGIYIYRQLKRLNYKDLTLAGKGAIGFSFLVTGEFIRSSIVWEILHFNRPGSYASGAAMLIVALILIAIGSLCCIRVFSPAKWGHWPWITALVVAVGLSVLTMWAPP